MCIGKREYLVGRSEGLFRNWVLCGIDLHKSSAMGKPGYYDHKSRINITIFSKTCTNGSLNIPHDKSIIWSVRETKQVFFF
jgi:hypothetical protein